MTGRQLVETVKANNAAAREAKRLSPTGGSVCSGHVHMEAQLAHGAANFEAIAEFLGNGMTTEVTAAVERAVERTTQARTPELRVGRFVLRGYTMHDVVRLVVVLAVVYVVLAINGLAPRRFSLRMEAPVGGAEAASGYSVAGR